MNWFFGKYRSLLLTIIISLVLATGIRLFDLTDLPLDFAPTRQLFSALKARGMYYAMLPTSAEGDGWKKEVAIRQWQSIQMIEPPVIEMLTALTYRVTGEHLWIARIFSSMFWVMAGWFLFLLAREISGPGGGIVALLFYLFLPYGVIASRAFQPDPLMVALIISGAWASFRWAQKREWKWALAAGILNGLAIFVKNVAVFPLAFALAGLVLEAGLVKSLKDRQTWAVATLSLIPTVIYTLYGLLVAGFLGQQFAFRFFPQLWLEPGFYLRWKGQIDGVIGAGAFAAALAGLFVAKRRGMVFLAGLWVGYIVYGLTFAYHISTHDYYQLVLIPIVALSLSPVAETLFEKATGLHTAGDKPAQPGYLIPRIIFATMMFLAVAIQVWTVRVELVRDDWRPDEIFWADLGETLGQNGTVLTIAQDYGYRLAYWGWQDVDSWYDSGDLELRSLDGRQIDLMERFQEQAAGKRFFVVTQSGKFDQQPEIRDFIYQTYPIFAEDQGYIIFDLAKNKQP